MAKHFDSVTKYLIDLHPADWLALVGRPGLDAEPIDIEFLDTDLATVTSQADRVLRVNGPEPSLQHIEMETGHHGADTPKRLLRSSVLLSSKFDLPVRTTVILLRREADSPALNGVLEYHESSALYLRFQYNVIRVWQLSAETLLTGGLGTLPLAPIADVTDEQLPGIVRRMEARIESEATTLAERSEFWIETMILMGLRYPQALTDDLLKGVQKMKESVTYQAILEEGIEVGIERGIERGREEGIDLGRLEGERSILIRLAAKRLGPPSARVLEALTAITSHARLAELSDRFNDVETWDDLLAAE